MTYKAKNDCKLLIVRSRCVTSVNLMAVRQSWVKNLFFYPYAENVGKKMRFLPTTDDWQDELSLENWYLRDKEGLHI